MLVKRLASTACALALVLETSPALAEDPARMLVAPLDSVATHDDGTPLARDAVSPAVGLVAGALPARRAANQQPVDALRAGT